MLLFIASASLCLSLFFISNLSRALICSSLSTSGNNYCLRGFSSIFLVSNSYSYCAPTLGSLVELSNADTRYSVILFSLSPNNYYNYYILFWFRVRIFVVGVTLLKGEEHSEAFSLMLSSSLLYFGFCDSNVFFYFAASSAFYTALNLY